MSFLTIMLLLILLFLTSNQPNPHALRRKRVRAARRQMMIRR